MTYTNNNFYENTGNNKPQKKQIPNTWEKIANLID